MVTHLKLLFRLWLQPAAAMSEVLDHGSLLFASLAAIGMAIAMQAGPIHLPFSFYSPLLVLAVVYVPGVLLMSNWIAHLGGLTAVFQRDYSALLTCAAMGWSAAQLPLLVAVWTAPQQVFLIIAACCGLYFAVLMFFAVRTVFGTGNGAAGMIIGFSWVPLVGAALLWGPLGGVLRLLASPFFLFYAFYYLRGEFGNLGQGFRSRQNFQRMLQAAAINPHDAEAQYQLGLIAQQRHQLTEAIRRFQAAVAIDPTETDSHFQLGRIAYEQGRFTEALPHLEIVLKQDNKHSLNEIHRELGATYLALGRVEDARRELALYTDRREYDPEGLYHYGQVLERLGEPGRAREMYVRAVESARTAPHYRRRFIAKWSRMAQKQARRLASA